MSESQTPDSTSAAPLPANLRTGVVVGNPKPASRTYQAAVRLAELLTGRAPDLTIDLAEYGAGLLDWSDAATAGAVSDVIALDLLVVASPTYKASYTGLLKLFLDRFKADSLAGVVTIPLMLGAGPGHAMAPEVFLKPVLTELGALLPTRALYLLDSSYDDPAAYESWIAAARGPVRAALAANTRPS